MTTLQAYFQSWAFSLTVFELHDAITTRVDALEHIAADRPGPPPLAQSIAADIRAGIDAALNELCERCR